MASTPPPVRAPRFDQRLPNAVAFGELLRHVHNCCIGVEDRLESRTEHGPGVAVTRSFFLLELRRFRGLLFAPVGLFAAGRGRGMADHDVAAAIDFFEAHHAQGAQFIEYLFSQNEVLAVRAWTLLEATARHVWTAALDAHPAAARAFWPESPLPRLVKKITKRERARKPPKRIPEKIGTALDEQGISFSNLEALADRFHPMSKAFAEELATSAALRALNAARHVIVHRAGVIDKRFVKDTAVAAQPGYRLGPRFGDIATWAGAAIGYAQKCLEVTDEWEFRVDPMDRVPWPPDFSGG